MRAARMSYREITQPQNFIGVLQPAVLLAAVLLVGSNAFVLSPILSEVAGGLATQPFRIAWSISAFGAATAISALTLAGMIDRVPPARVLGGAALLLALAQLSSGVSGGWLWLCLSQALAGLAIGILLPGTYATAVATAPAGREAARLGLILTGWALSLVFAVPLAAWVTERLGWRAVYWGLAALSALVALCLALVLRNVEGREAARMPPWRALRLPGVAPLLVVSFAFMTAFYGSFAFFGDGMRAAFGLSAKGGGLFVLAYGLGFGLAGLALGFAAPRITRPYFLLVLGCIALSYACWRFALMRAPAAFVAAMIWGAFNQLCVNAMVVSLNQRAGKSRGAVMGLNSAVTYLAVFAGPIIMGPIYAGAGFVAVANLAAVFVIVAAVLAWRVL